MVTHTLMDRPEGTITLNDKQYTINLKNREGQFHVSLDTPQQVVINAVLDNRSKSEVKAICHKYNRRDHSGNLRILKNSTSLVWGKPVDNTLITFATTIPDNQEQIRDMVAEEFPILQEEYKKGNYDRVKSILIQVKQFLRTKGVRVRIPKKERFEVQTTLDIDDNIDEKIIMQQTIDTLIEETSNLGKKLEDLKYLENYAGLLSPHNIAILTVVLPAIKRNICPYCGAPLKITKVGKGKPSAGEIRLGCSSYEKYAKGKYIAGGNSCHFFACVPDWAYVLLMDHIDGAIAENEWLDNPNFVTSEHINLLNEFKEVRKTISKNHELNNFDSKTYKRRTL